MWCVVHDGGMHYSESVKVKMHRGENAQQWSREGEDVRQ